jgi:hypothetical protein
MSGMTNGHGAPALFAATATTLLLAACGANSAGDDQPSAGQPGDAKRLAFIACLRKAGVDARDGIRGGVEIRGSKAISETRMGTIERDCARKTGGGPGGRAPSKAEQARFLDQALKFARCMRAHGIPMRDPSAAGGGIKMVVPRGSAPEINPKGPAFRRAEKECGSLMPGKPGASPTKGLGGGFAVGEAPK